MVFDQPHPQGMKIQCWVKLPRDQGSDQRCSIFISHHQDMILFSSHTCHEPQVSSFLFVSSTSLLVKPQHKDLRHLFHRNTTAAYLRDVLPHFSFKSFTKVWSSRNWFPATVFICLTWHHGLLQVKLSSHNIPDTLYIKLNIKLQNLILISKKFRPYNLPC